MIRFEMVTLREFKTVEEFKEFAEFFLHDPKLFDCPFWESVLKTGHSSYQTPDSTNEGRFITTIARLYEDPGAYSVQVIHDQSARDRI